MNEIGRIDGEAGAKAGVRSRSTGIASTFAGITVLFSQSPAAMIGGAIGLVLALVGAVATWSHPEKFGAHWYPVALVIPALPTAWAGGKIRIAHVNRAGAVPRA